MRQFSNAPRADRFAPIVIPTRAEDAVTSIEYCAHGDNVMLPMRATPQSLGDLLRRVLEFAGGPLIERTTWERGREIVTAHRTAKEGPLPEFIEKLHRDGVRRVPGTAVFPHPTKMTTPIALRANFEHNHVVHEHVVIVSMVSENVPYIPVDQRLSIDDLGYSDDGIVHVTVRHGFQDHQDLPAELRRAARLPGAELRFDPDRASYFLSYGALRLTRAPGMRRWRKRLFLALARNAANRAESFALPETRTVLMGSRIDL